jgi:hypothetical protein
MFLKGDRTLYFSVLFVILSSAVKESCQLCLMRSQTHLVQLSGTKFCIAV